MRFWAILLPFVAILMARKPIQALIALVLQLTILGWIPTSIYAWGVVNDFKADQRMKKQVKYEHKYQEKQAKKEA